MTTKRIADATLGEVEAFYAKYHAPITGAPIKRLISFLGVKQTDLYIEERRYPIYQLADISAALGHFLKTHGLKAELIGVKPMWTGNTIEGADSLFSSNVSLVPPIKARLKVGLDQERAVPVDVAYLIEGGKPKTKFIAFLARAGQYYSQNVLLGYFRPETPQAADAAADFFREIDEWWRKNTCYRGKAIKPLANQWSRGLAGFDFIQFPKISRDEILLEAPVWDQIDRNLFLFYHKRTKFQATGIELKRGILLSGKPGTGKTMLCQHIVNTLEGYTAIYVPTFASGLISPVVEAAKALQPSIVIMEDVDLIAQDRMTNQDCKALLGELMNQMEGFSPADDVIFLFTTNNLQSIEPAIVARPGRIDHIISFPDPNADLRRSLIQRYSGNIRLDVNMDHWANATEALVPAAIKELIKKACSSAIARNGASKGRVTILDRDLETAIADLRGQYERIRRHLPE